MIDYILSKITLIRDPGISHEIGVVFKYDSGVEFFDVHTNSDEMRYIIDVRLKEYDDFYAKILFHNFATFIQYGKFVYHIRTVNEKERSVFEFITASDDLKGFHCSVTFH